MTGEDRVFNFGQDRVVVADDSGQDGLVVAQALEQIVAHLDPYRHGLIAGAPEFSERAIFGHVLIHKAAGTVSGLGVIEVSIASACGASRSLRRRGISWRCPLRPWR